MLPAAGKETNWELGIDFPPHEILKNNVSECMLGQGAILLCSDDDTLLDWERYDSLRKFKCWGMDCSLVARFCPFMPCVPNEWYYRSALFQLFQ